MRPLVLLVLLLACARAQAADPTVFIHGIKGSVLEDAEGGTRWLTLAQALGLSTPELALPLAWDQDGNQKRDGLKATRPLDRVTFVPGLASADVYGKFIEAMPEPFAAFAYDWRRENRETVE